jgi:hypothetical protein
MKIPQPCKDGIHQQWVTPIEEGENENPTALKGQLPSTTPIEEGENENPTALKGRHPSTMGNAH